jgi:hypothetical protein
MLRPTLRALPLSVALAACAATPGCVSSQRMCDAQFACTGTASCVAGRCVAAGATATINGARRLLFEPVDVAYIQRGAGGDQGSQPEIATLGDGRRPRAIALLRFAVPLPPEATVVEAYLLLQRAPDVEADPTALLLHAARIVEPWDGRGVTWATQPGIEETRAPETRVSTGAGPLVRLDVHELVELWRQRSGEDFGLAVIAEPADPAGAGDGLPFVWRPGGEDRAGPRLELYIK